MSQALNSIRRNNPQGNGQVDQARNSNVFNFPALLEKSKGEIARALPKHIDPDRMLRIALTTFRTNPGLAKCNPVSVLAAVIQASQLGLEIGQNGEAYLVPFKDECQMIPGYLGLMKLARNSGMIRDIYAHEVRENDRFELRLGLNRHLDHEPLQGRGGFPASELARGEITGFYSVAVFKDGSTTFVPMSVDDVLRIRDASRGYQSSKRFNKQSTWDTDFVPMGKKTAIRALCKLLPKSAELSAALALDGAAERGLSQNISLKQAADGSYEPPVFSEVDPDTGEIHEDTPVQHQAEQRPNVASSAADHRQQATTVETRAPRQAAPAPTRAAAPVKPQQAAPAQAAQAPQQQQQAPKSGVAEVTEKMEAALAVSELDEIYIRAQVNYQANDLDTINFAYEKVRNRLEGVTTDMFPQ